MYFLGTNLNSSIICCLSSGDMYLFLGVVISTSSSFVSLLSFLLLLLLSLLLCNYFVDFFFETLLFLSAILLPIKSPVALDVFWIALFEFEAVFIESAVRFFSAIKKFLTIFIA